MERQAIRARRYGEPGGRAVVGASPHHKRARATPLRCRSHPVHPAWPWENAPLIYRPRRRIARRRLLHPVPRASPPAPTPVGTPRRTTGSGAPPRSLECASRGPAWPPPAPPASSPPPPGTGAPRAPTRHGGIGYRRPLASPLRGSPQSPGERGGWTCPEVPRGATRGTERIRSVRICTLIRPSGVRRTRTRVCPSGDPLHHPRLPPRRAVRRAPLGPGRRRGPSSRPPPYRAPRERKPRGRPTERPGPQPLRDRRRRSPLPSPTAGGANGRAFQHRPSPPGRLSRTPAPRIYRGTRDSNPSRSPSGIGTVVTMYRCAKAPPAVLISGNSAFSGPAAS